MFLTAKGGLTAKQSDSESQKKMSKKRTRWDAVKKKMPFSIDTTNWVMRNLPFIFFIAFLGFIYIANARYAEKKVRNIQTLQKEIQKVSWEYLSIKSDLMLKSMQTQDSA